MCISEFLIESDDFTISLGAQWNMFAVFAGTRGERDTTQMQPAMRCAPAVLSPAARAFEPPIGIAHAA